MPVYACRVADEKGRIEEVVLEAASEESCLREVAARNPFVLSLRECAHGARGARRSRGFSRRMLCEFTDLITLMLGAGLSLPECLEVAQGAFARGEGNALATRLLERIRKGSTFTAALESVGSGIPPFYTAMVRIGERIGSLDQVFSRLAACLKEEKGLRDRFTSALLYPAIVTGVATASAIFIVAVVFPRLREIFASLGPGSAGKVGALLGSLNSALAAVAVVLSLGVALVVGMVLARRRGGALALRIDTLLLTLPLLSRFLKQRELLNFTFAMEALTAAGIGVEEGLSEGAGAMTNRALRHAVASIRERLLKGERLSAAFAGSPLFPDRIARWMAIGERVGRVEKVFGQLRAYYQQEVEKWITRLMALVEPALIVGLGILILLFVAFFILPVFSLFGAFP
jgi:general secretion pathway protein F